MIVTVFTSLLGVLYHTLIVEIHRNRKTAPAEIPMLFSRENERKVLGVRNNISQMVIYVNILKIYIDILTK